MDKWKFTRWCNTAAGKIRYYPDRELVTQELRDHLEDRYDAFLAAGCSEKEAVEKALDAMGSAEEIAPQLAAVHRPYWGWFYSFTKFLLILSLLFPLLTIIINAETYPGRFDFWSPQWGSYDPYEDTHWENRTKLVHIQPDSVWKSDGYTVKLTDAVLWGTGDGYRDFRCLLRVTSCLPWDRTNFCDYIWAEDSLGNRYYAYTEYLFDRDRSDRYFLPNDCYSGIFTQTIELTPSLSVPEGAEWITLHYDRSGRNMVFCIDLTGGDST